MDDRDILNAISDMIATEHSVRLQLDRGEVAESPAREDLASLETCLDQCWDLLHRRRARAEFDRNRHIDGVPLLEAVTEG